ncbi:FtsZ/tubulin family protein [Caldibacillus debilis]|uniref:Tubulin/FtsZ GTPase domain-containing protein n=1 Tax=Caldibacillus debilis TaxID=301148 RepID=A0A150MAC2_9BACI|nr:cell division protein FtsZ [Caldibacillus debilis]KYD21391.1 hypothetical protein B4135_1671 [Caldibacillus debilis]
MIKPFSENNNLGALRALMSKHLFSDEVKNEMDRFLSQTIIGLGQGGGRIASELARLGFPTFLINSSKSDMEEFKNLIPAERRLLTRSKKYAELEGTDKNAQLGYEIAVENKEIYKKVAMDNAVRNAEFVWVCVSLGGGTGNGALKVALTYLSAVRQEKILPTGKIPLGVICSLPSKDEKGSSFRKNALAGINLLKKFQDENKIGSVLVIDNEKMKNYYEEDPLRTYGGRIIDAKSYSNMVVASTIAEISSIPLLEGRVVLDKTELLSTLSTPGWLSVSKYEVEQNDNINSVIKRLFSENEVLANYKTESAISGAVAVLYPVTKNMDPKIADDVYAYASNLLDTQVNLSVSINSKIQKLTLYGLAVYLSPSLRIKELYEELKEWEEIEKSQRELKKATLMELNEFDDFFQLRNETPSRTTVNLDDLDVSFGENASDSIPAEPSGRTTIRPVDLDDIDF